MKSPGDNRPSTDKMIQLLSAYSDGWLDESQRQELLELLRRDPEARAAFIEHSILDSLLFSRTRNGLSRLQEETPRGWGGSSTATPTRQGAGSSQGGFLFPADLPVSPPNSVPFPVIVLDPIAVAQPTALSLNSPVGSMMFSYAMSALFVCVGLLIGWMCKVSEQQQVVRHDVHTITAPVPPPVPKMVLVGRITGLFDCRFSSDRDILPAPGYAHVPLGRKYKLDSGLMEITYDTGAVVILQGPVTYEVESAHGGFLSMGKLTARVDKRGEGGREKGEKSNQQYSPLFSLPAPLFMVCTPTAIVTDLGTEFGVEVDRQGTTQSHVFRGKVSLIALDDGREKRGGEVTLGANESARVEKTDAGGNGTAVVVVNRLAADAPLPDFVRELPGAPQTRTLDLVDIVTGGNGTFGRRELGINAVTGSLCETWRPSEGEEYAHAYSPVTWQPLIDGVFVPRPSKKPVQLDSAGHTFNKFNLSYDTGDSWGPIWAGKNMIQGVRKSDGVVDRISVTLGGIDYGSAGHGALGMHANKGITFSLQAIRRRFPGWRIVKFQAVAGNTEPITARKDPQEPYVSADVWVFVDGNVRVEKTNINSTNAPVAIDIPLADTDRFLTLVSTDAGNGTYHDWIMFGDPRLELRWTGADRAKEVGNNTKSERLKRGESALK
jgi:hypothetical protein